MVLFISFGLFADTTSDVKAYKIKKGEPAPFDGFIITTDRSKEISFILMDYPKLQDKVKLLETQNLSFTALITEKDFEIKTLKSQIDQYVLMDSLYQEKIKLYQDIEKQNQWLKIGTSVGITISVTELVVIGGMAGIMYFGFNALKH